MLKETIQERARKRKERTRKRARNRKERTRKRARNRKERRRRRRSSPTEAAARKRKRKRSWKGAYTELLLFHNNEFLGVANGKPQASINGKIVTRSEIRYVFPNEPSNNISSITTASTNAVPISTSKTTSTGMFIDKSIDEASLAIQISNALTIEALQSRFYFLEKDNKNYWFTTEEAAVSYCSGIINGVSYIEEPIIVAQIS